MTEYIVIINTDQDPSIGDAHDLALQIDMLIPGADSTVLTPIHDGDSGATFHPHVGPNGELGYRAEVPGCADDFLMLNPSGGSDDGVACIFVYQGETGDVHQDTPYVHFDMGQV